MVEVVLPKISKYQFGNYCQIDYAVLMWAWQRWCKTWFLSERWFGMLTVFGYEKPHFLDSADTLKGKLCVFSVLWDFLNFFFNWNYYSLNYSISFPGTNRAQIVASSHLEVGECKYLDRKLFVHLDYYSLTSGKEWRAAERSRHAVTSV